ncbi:MAG: hypothetical protein KBS99_02350 [Prevotellaceae bacterium]|nr:hypothetical protein [Candidatus Colivivens caballi]
MKKSLILAASVVALTGCANDPIAEVENNIKPVDDAPITLASGTKVLSRADRTGEEAATLLNNNFVVEGVKSKGVSDGLIDSPSEVFDHYNVNYTDGSAGSTDSNTEGWEYVGQDVHELSTSLSQSIKFWDYSTAQYDFVAFSYGMGGATGTTLSEINYRNIGKAVKTTGADAVYTVTGSAEALAETYIANLTTVKKASYQSTVTPTFRNMGAKVRLALYEVIPGYSIRDVKFYQDATSTTPTTTPALFADSKVIPGGDGKMSVYFPTIGKDTDKDNNKAHVMFTGGTDNESVITFSDLKYTTLELGERKSATAPVPATTADSLFLGRASSEATYAGDLLGTDAAFVKVLPTGEGHVLNLKVDFTLVPIDGSEEVIGVYGASAVVPAKVTDWQPNYAYTYIFKISENVDGYTDPDDPDSPKGLYPITFDAVVMDDIDGGVQETIHAVGDPTITTYQQGKVVTVNNEYVGGKNIYVMVGDEMPLNQTFETVGSVALFTTTIDEGALQNLDERSIANCYINGTVSGDNITVTDAKGKKLTLTKSDKLTIPGIIPANEAPHGVAIEATDAIAKIAEPVAATKYVFQYKDAIAQYGTPVTNTLTADKIYYTFDGSTYNFYKAKGYEVVGGTTKYYEYDGTTYTEVTLADCNTLTKGKTYYKNIDAETGLATAFAAYGDEEPGTTYFTRTAAPQYTYKIIVVK